MQTETEQKQSSLKPSVSAERAILDAIFGIMGKPPEFHSVRMMNVFDDKWRITIFSGDPPLPNDCFFVKWRDGEIVTSNPVIKKKY